MFWNDPVLTIVVLLHEILEALQRPPAHRTGLGAVLHLDQVHMGLGHGEVTARHQYLGLPFVKQSILSYVGGPNMTKEISDVYENLGRKPQAFLGAVRNRLAPHPAWAGSRWETSPEPRPSYLPESVPLSLAQGRRGPL